MQKIKLLLFVFILSLMLPGCSSRDTGVIEYLEPVGNEESLSEYIESSNYIEDSYNFKSEEDVYIPFTYDYENIPEYSGNPTVEINDNKPFFETDHLSTQYSWTELSDLDELGRNGTCSGILSMETVAKEERGDISYIYPAGWKQANYECIKDGWLYNRTHLLMWKAAGILDDPRVLITGTSYMNKDGMLPYENLILYDIFDGYHVYYRTTPVYVGDELVCRGVLMEAYSIEDRGNSVEFCVFAYNVAPGIEINYNTGESIYNGVFLDKTSDTVIYKED